jgi:glycosyltransferase involved in cell wall biosynthesis
VPGEIKRLGLYVDASFRRGGTAGAPALFRGAGDFGFMHFAAAVGAGFDRFAVIARETEDEDEAPNQLPAGIELIPLPHYPSLRRVGRLIAALPRTVAAMWRGLADLDAVWVSGVHPLGLLMIALAGIRRRRVVLLIRQDSPAYFRSRLPSRAWTPVMAPLMGLDAIFRLLARRMRTTVVGADVARRYRAPRPNVLEMRINLLARPQLAAAASSADWSGAVGLLTVGRIDREKNPLLAAAALAELQGRDPGRYTLTWVGVGPLAEPLREEASRLGVGDRLRLAGFVPFGCALLERYRDAHAFVHVAVTEGLPQVLYEAMGSGTPIVATDVGGVRDALDDGRGGLLVPPADAQALADAIERLEADPGLRRDVATRALELAAEGTIESESARVAAFIGDGARGGD